MTDKTSSETEEIDEIMDFLSFALDPSTSFRGSVQFNFEVSTDPNVAPAPYVVHIHDVETPVVRVDKASSDQPLSCEVTLSVADFLHLYSGQVTSHEIMHMCYSGRVKVHSWRSGPALSQFASAFDFSSERWARYYQEKETSKEPTVEHLPERTTVPPMVQWTHVLFNSTKRKSESSLRTCQWTYHLEHQSHRPSSFTTRVGRQPTQAHIRPTVTLSRFSQLFQPRLEWTAPGIKKMSVAEKIETWTDTILALDATHPRAGRRRRHVSPLDRLQDFLYPQKKKQSTPSQSLYIPPYELVLREIKIHSSRFLQRMLIQLQSGTQRKQSAAAPARMELESGRCRLENSIPWAWPERWTVQEQSKVVRPRLSQPPRYQVQHAVPQNIQRDVSRVQQVLGRKFERWARTYVDANEVYPHHISFD